MKLIAACVALGALTATAVLAQDSNVIQQRKDLMKRSGAQSQIGAKMVRGEEPFDLAKAQTIFATYADKAAKLTTLFPENSRTGETRALPAIWEKPDAFKATVAKFDADIKAAQASTKDLDSFKTAFAAVGRNCTSCHEQFRRPQQ